MDALRRECDDGNLPDLRADQLITKLSRACDAIMPRKGRAPAYWWTEALSDLRRACLRFGQVGASACRVVMAKTKGVTAPTEQSPAMLEKTVEGLFPRCKLRPWPPVVESLHVQRSSIPNPNVVNEYHVGVGDGTVGDEALVTSEELIVIAKSLMANRAPGPDGIPNLAIKAAILEAS